MHEGTPLGEALENEKAKFSFKKIWVNKKFQFVFMGLISLVLMGLLWSWSVAIIILPGIILHENGHLFVARKLKIKDYGMQILPLIGAVAKIELSKSTFLEEFKVAIAGPMIGSIPMFLAFGVNYFYPSPWLGAIVVMIAFITLFNLLPVYPMDGGRIFHSIFMSRLEKYQKLYMVFNLILCLVIGVKFNPGLGILFGMIGYLGLSREQTKIRARKMGSDGVEYLISKGCSEEEARDSMVRERIKMTPFQCLLSAITTIAFIVVMVKIMTPISVQAGVNDLLRH